MAGRFGRLGELAVGAMLVVAACGANPTSEPAPSTGAASTTGSSPGQGLRGERLGSGIEPGGLDADRFAFLDRQGAVVLSLGTGQSVRLPRPPRGLVFRPTGISGNLVIGQVSGGLELDPLLVEAMAYDLASGSWVDVARALPAGHSSSAVATDGATIVGQDLGMPGGRGPAHAYAFDVASAAVSTLPDLAGGAPVPTAVGGGVIVGGTASAGGAVGATRGGGWIWGQASQQYTMLAAVAGTDRAMPLAVAGGTVVGVVAGAAAAADSPFAYDVTKRSFTDMHLAGVAARDISGRMVLLAQEAGWGGWLQDLDTGGSIPFAAVNVDGSATGVRPWAMSDQWVIALTPPPAGSSASDLVAINVPPEP